MKTLRVYWISNAFDVIADRTIEKEITLTPRIPDSASLMEDHRTPRVCCAMSMVDCLSSLEVSWRIAGNECQYFNVYEADVPIEILYQPTIEEVPDVWYTNELWILNTQTFKLVGTYRLRRMIILNGSPYARFSFTRQGEDEVVDRLFDANVYGSPEAFTYIEADFIRHAEFI